MKLVLGSIPVSIYFSKPEGNERSDLGSGKIGEHLRECPDRLSDSLPWDLHLLTTSLSRAEKSVCTSHLLTAVTEEFRLMRQPV